MRQNGWKRLLAAIVMLALCGLAGQPGAALAAEAGPNMALFPSAGEVEGLIDALRLLAAVDDGISFSKADMTVGERLNVYFYIDGSFVPSRAAVYPVFYAGELCGILQGGTRRNADYFADNFELVEPLRQLLREDEGFSLTTAFALVFDRRNAYLYDGASWRRLWTYGSNIAPRDELDVTAAIDTSGIRFNTLEYVYSLGELRSMALPERRQEVDIAALLARLIPGGGGVYRSALAAALAERWADAAAIAAIP